MQIKPRVMMTKERDVEGVVIAGRVYPSDFSRHALRVFTNSQQGLPHNCDAYQNQVEDLDQ